MTTLRQQVIERLQQKGYMVPAEAGLQGTCSQCRGAISQGGYSTCYQCAIKHPQDYFPERLGFGVYAQCGTTSAMTMAGYKSASPGEMNKIDVKCLAYLGLTEALETQHFDLVTTIPSYKNRTEMHPLHQIVGNVSTYIPKCPDVKQVLRPNMEEITKLAERQASDKTLGVTGSLAGKSVILIDDTWTTGSHMLSATIALKNAGAKDITGIALARWLRSDPFSSSIYALAKKTSSFQSHSFFHTHR